MYIFTILLRNLFHLVLILIQKKNFLVPEYFVVAVVCIKKPTNDYLNKKFNNNQRPNKHELNKIASNAHLNSNKKQGFFQLKLLKFYWICSHTKLQIKIFDWELNLGSVKFSFNLNFFQNACTHI